AQQETKWLPRLAIINKHQDKSVADLLVGELSAGGEFALVERDQLERIITELQLSSAARQNSVRAGQILGADALLFIESDNSTLHLRLVETHRGERISEAIYTLNKPDLRAIASATKARLAIFAPTL